MKCPECGEDLNKRRETYYCGRCWRYFPITELEKTDRKE